MKKSHLIAFVAIMVLVAGVVYAQDLTDPVAWEGLEIPIGQFAVSWTAVTYAVIQFVKSLKRRDTGEALIQNDRIIWVINAVVGSIGVVIANIVVKDVTIAQALVNGVLSFLAASGLFRFLKENGLDFLVPSSSAPSNPESESNQPSE